MPVVVDFTTIPEMFQKITAKYAREKRPILIHKVNGTYQGTGFSELRRQVELLTLGLASLGLRRGERVAIISENRPEWVISDQAVALLGGVDVPIYPSMTAKQIEFIFSDAGVRFAIVSNQFQLNKVLRVSGDVKTLDKIILMSDKGQVGGETLGFSGVMRMGEKFESEHPGYLAESLKSVQPEDLLTIIYTSGTTGNPKGVMLTHANLVDNIINAAKVIDLGPKEVLLSFLPLCHSFERMAGYYTAMACGATVAYAESVETVRDNMLEIRPTVITTVPRLFERIHARAMKQVDSESPLRRKIFHWGLSVGKDYSTAKRGKRVPVALAVKHMIADRVVFRTFKARAGGRIRFFVSGGAALGKEFGEFFDAVGLRIIEGYGLTESSPVISVNPLEDYRFGSVGKPIPGIEVRIAGDGEILTRGAHVMKGYWNDPVATHEVVDEEGWLHTGDIGRIDDDGYLFITDRKKHLFVSSGGKNIAPQPLENLFLTSKYVEQFVLIGDRRMFLTALIVPDFDALKEYADARNLRYNNQTELTRLREINQLVEGDLAVLQRDLANYERVRKFVLLDKPFTVEEGELTPTQKVRRRVVEQRYAHLIEEMYEGIN